MSINRTHELELLRTGITLPLGEPDSGRLFCISGLFGVGKSWAIDRLFEELLAKSSIDALLSIRDLEGIDSFPELCKSLADSCVVSEKYDNLFNRDETYFTYEKYFDCLYEIKSKEYNFYENLTGLAKFKSFSNYKKYDTENPIDKKEIEGLVNALFVKKGDRRVLLETESVVIESLIVDLMNKFFPINSEKDNFENYLQKSCPKKIVIILDNFDHADYSISKWLFNVLLPYAWERTFSSFITFKIPDIDSKTKISDFFDFRFVVACRKNLSGANLNLPNINSARQIVFAPLTPDEINDFVHSIEIELPVSVQDIYQKTKGIHGFFVQCINSLNTDTKNPCIEINYELLLKDIFADRTEEERDWVIASAFLGEFDEEGLRCFSEIADDRHDVFLYLKDCYEYQSKNNKIVIDPTISAMIQDYFYSTYPELAKEYYRTSNIYMNIVPLLELIAPEDREIVRNLAYFEKFDVALPLDAPFNISGSRIDTTIDNYEWLFVKNKFSWSIKEEYLTRFAEYNSLVDIEFTEKQKLAKRTWDKYYTEIGQKVMMKEQSILDSKEKAKDLQLELDILEKEYVGYQTAFFDAENKVLEFNRKLEKFKLKNNIKFVIKNFLFASFSFLLLFFSPVYITGTFLTNYLYHEILYYSLISLTSLFLILSISGLLKYTLLQSKIKERKAIVIELKKFERERNKAVENMEKLSSDKSDNEKKIAELIADVESVENDIDHLRTRLVEN